MDRLRELRPVPQPVAIASDVDDVRKKGTVTFSLFSFSFPGGVVPLGFRSPTSGFTLPFLVGVQEMCRYSGAYRVRASQHDPFGATARGYWLSVLRWDSPHLSPVTVPLSQRNVGAPWYANELRKGVRVRSIARRLVETRRSGTFSTPKSNVIGHLYQTVLHYLGRMEVDMSQSHHKEFIKCMVVKGPWLFEDERFVTITVGEIVYQSIVDRSDVRVDTTLEDDVDVEGFLRVYDVEEDSGGLCVLLPRETVSHGWRVWVPSELLKVF